MIHTVEAPIVCQYLDLYIELRMGSSLLPIYPNRKLSIMMVMMVIDDDVNDDSDDDDDDDDDRQ